MPTTNTDLLYYCYGMASTYARFGYIPKECIEKFKQMDAAQEKRSVERPINYEEGA